MKELVDFVRESGASEQVVPKKDGEDMSCFMGRALISVNAYGDVFPCIMAPIPAGNVRYASLSQIWWDSPFLRSLRNRNGTDGLHTCTSCSFRCDCDRCPGTAFTETGDLFGPSPSACLTALAVRSVRLGWKTEQSPPPELPSGLVHSDSQMWQIHDVLDSMGFGCAGTRLGSTHTELGKNLESSNPVPAMQEGAR
jgi:hypothetical protein